MIIIFIVSIIYFSCLNKKSFKSSKTIVKKKPLNIETKGLFHQFQFQPEICQKLMNSKTWWQGILPMKLKKLPSKKLTNKISDNV